MRQYLILLLGTKTQRFSLCRYTYARLRRSLLHVPSPQFEYLCVFFLCPHCDLEASCHTSVDFLWTVAITCYRLGNVTQI